MLVLNSPAKLNLFLHVVGKRPDGYHNLASLFQTVSLIDTITIKRSSQDSFTCNDSSLCSPDNLILKALALFRKKTNKLFPCAIHLEKNIPIQAGLGGGSSNAATTLWGLNQLEGTLVNDKNLAEWSIELGADIPFFFSSGTAFCTGKGENVQDLPSLNLPSYLLVKPARGLSTPAVFKNLDLTQIQKHDPDQILDQFLKKPTYFNDLEKSAFQLSPELSLLKQELQNAGFQSVTMTGSGSAFFCIGEKQFFKDTLFCKRVKTISRSKSEWY